MMAASSTTAGSAGTAISNSDGPGGAADNTNSVRRLRVPGKKARQSASRLLRALLAGGRTNVNNNNQHGRRDRRPSDATAGADLGLGLALPGPRFHPLQLPGGGGGSSVYCFAALDPLWGGGYVFFRRSGKNKHKQKKGGGNGSCSYKWKPVIDQETIWLLTAAVTVGAGAGTMTGPPRGVGLLGGICTALRARDVELDAGVTARALSYLDCISLVRTEAVSKTFRHDISRIAWNGMANELSREVKDRAKKRLFKVTGEESVRAKDMVIYAQKEKIASDYVDEIVAMDVYEFACRGRLLSELVPSADDYEIFVRFSSGERVLCQGFFDLVRDRDFAMLGVHHSFNIIKQLDDADLSQWPEMEDVLKCLRLPLAATSADIIRASFNEMKPWDLVFTIVAIHKRSLQPSIVFSENQRLGCESVERPWGDDEVSVDSDGEIYIADIYNGMDFSAHHKGRDLNDASARPATRKCIQGDLSLRPLVPGQKHGYGWTRECYLFFEAGSPSETWDMCFSDVKKRIRT